MKMTNSTRATLVQTYNGQQSTFDVVWDIDEYTAIEQGIQEAVANLNQLLTDVSARVALAKHVYD